MTSKSLIVSNAELETAVTDYTNQKEENSTIETQETQVNEETGTETVTNEVPTEESFATFNDEDAVKN